MLSNAYELLCKFITFFLLHASRQICSLRQTTPPWIYIHVYNNKVISSIKLSHHLPCILILLVHRGSNFQFWYWRKPFLNLSQGQPVRGLCYLRRRAVLLYIQSIARQKQTTFSNVVRDPCPQSRKKGFHQSLHILPTTLTPFTPFSQLCFLPFLPSLPSLPGHKT